MRAFVLRYAGTPLGRVELDDGEPAGGSLEPLPAYQSLGAVFRRAGNLLWAYRARWLRLGLEPGSPVPGWPTAPDARTAEAVHRAEEARARLELATEEGVEVPVASIDIADARFQREPPFVLVHFRAQPAAVPAPLPEPASGGEDSRPAA